MEPKYTPARAGFGKGAHPSAPPAARAAGNTSGEHCRNPAFPIVRMKIRIVCPAFFQLAQLRRSVGTLCSKSFFSGLPGYSKFDFRLYGRRYLMNAGWGR